MENSRESIPHEVAELLGYYVYALRDPRDGRVFYVGKGVRGRINAHSQEAGKNPASERAKLHKINDIEASGSRVELLFLRTGITDEATSFMVEQAVIDAFAANHQPLTNLVKGHHAGEHGLATLDAVIARHGALPTPQIAEPLIMVKINRAWLPDMNDQELYEVTRGHWKIRREVRDQAKYALGVAHGVVRGAYSVDSWFPSAQPGEAGRWGFVGEPATELKHVIGTHVRDSFAPGSQNPYRKFLSGYKMDAAVASEEAEIL
ncbi:hypothetical protein GCM10027022_01980 [Alpinimonas psychrophila]|uniref:GIY-YIG domain-containing protein n=1 Tax=Alpinimonas psychrophila TaxID=748908 RepID=A0A7W3JRX1_9MICO|nr:hypothetical protein [Alpinimonas psychrophila]MBA8828007.1 hypothetical protein [Alpinimonas psychrophila]